ncbi:carboxypeptidase-like regulatory domain-containing protein [Paenibacillus methanolicus]|uniref:Uncharacterized protein n=1 Tax=Paenibacillus methanolicus TaxID=582686 RepID=A0A5S5BSM7_9BACL|nr:carboxypeptidase-like regulatory domain-containing protein [Paenibacillus methanolicus]TYP70175.1 hypothetical protein BCM02_112155 [Paenibacillus methanolicus]
MNKLGCVVLAACIVYFATVPVAAAAVGRDPAVTATLQVNVNALNGIRPVSDRSFSPVPHARILVIDRDGTFLTTGLSNAKGNWTMPVRVLIDPRFPTKRMGMLTVIVIAEGYSEQIFFDVPVDQHGFGEGDVRVTLDKIVAGRRCEPRAWNADGLHRFTVFNTLDYYAKQLGLEERVQIDGEMHWGPDIAPNPGWNEGQP